MLHEAKEWFEIDALHHLYSKLAGVEAAEVGYNVQILLESGDFLFGLVLHVSNIDLFLLLVLLFLFSLNLFLSCSLFGLKSLLLLHLDPHESIPEQLLGFLSMQESDWWFLILIGSGAHFQKSVEHIFVVLGGERGVVVERNRPIPEKLERLIYRRSYHRNRSGSVAHHVSSIGQLRVLTGHRRVVLFNLSVN